MSLNLDSACPISSFSPFNSYRDVNTAPASSKPDDQSPAAAPFASPPPLLLSGSSSVRTVRRLDQQQASAVPTSLFSSPTNASMPLVLERWQPQGLVPDHSAASHSNNDQVHQPTDRPASIKRSSSQGEEIESQLAKRQKQQAAATASPHSSQSHQSERRSEHSLLDHTNRPIDQRIDAEMQKFTHPGSDITPSSNEIRQKFLDIYLASMRENAELKKELQELKSQRYRSLQLQIEQSRRLQIEFRQQFHDINEATTRENSELKKELHNLKSQNGYAVQQQIECYRNLQSDLMVKEGIIAAQQKQLIESAERIALLHNQIATIPELSKRSLTAMSQIAQILEGIVMPSVIPTVQVIPKPPTIPFVPINPPIQVLPNPPTISAVPLNLLPRSTPAIPL